MDCGSACRAGCRMPGRSHCLSPIMLNVRNDVRCDGASTEFHAVCSRHISRYGARASLISHSGLGRLLLALPTRRIGSFGRLHLQSPPLAWGRTSVDRHRSPSCFPSLPTHPIQHPIHPSAGTPTVPQNAPLLRASFAIPRAGESSEPENSQPCRMPQSTRTPWTCCSRRGPALFPSGALVLVTTATAAAPRLPSPSYHDAVCVCTHTYLQAYRAIHRA
ncbi:hypothetical protein FA95DRAFT_1276699 [Auriscalpium vulgare]|uniref:Uncharacterized protein n=1 Tax=Auriscalpium vulgare TaxID=40419 RepID=A0ACB8RT24_9AGAM|nr:hypothetical protein FA95DRAFT_1276699 [Auriscalpium vulgare]